MRQKKHKRKENHVLIVTSDAVDANVKQYRFGQKTLQAVIFILCVIIGGLIGCFIFEGQIWQVADARLDTVRKENEEYLAAIAVLKEEKSALEAKVEELDQKIQILSNTVNEKVQNETELKQQLEKQKLPTEFPLTGSASMEESSENDHPICIFKASVGTTVVSTANGTVTAVNDDVDYGHSVWIDHGNGYVTIYKNKGDVVVQAGDSVVQGTTLFIIGEDNDKLGYQIMQDGAYIDPMDVLAING
ncbi:MAG: peptidoglycan DD-metalloendopeptidase family protein [Lachnospiraceae bacterium]|nr:peptidoglycan DD-metalloendopeptidase family protein [Lachnospiraceae bacterium]